jgi:hypothetical protein
MRLQKRQRGLGLWGWIFTLGMIGFAALVTMQLVPMYLNEMAIARVVRSTAQDPGNGGLSTVELRKAMQTRWDVEGINTLSTKDVKINKTATGRTLAYDYESRAELFYNISLVVHFQNEFPMKGGGAIE